MTTVSKTDETPLLNSFISFIILRKLSLIKPPGFFCFRIYSETLNILYVCKILCRAVMHTLHVLPPNYFNPQCHCHVSIFLKLHKGRRYIRLQFQSVALDRGMSGSQII